MSISDFITDVLPEATCVEYAVQPKNDHVGIMVQTYDSPSVFTDNSSCLVFGFEDLSPAENWNITINSFVEVHWVKELDDGYMLVLDGCKSKTVDKIASATIGLEYVSALNPFIEILDAWAKNTSVEVTEEQPAAGIRIRDSNDLQHALILRVSSTTKVTDYVIK